MHRDLKPGNVLVASLDPNAQVLCKITDFGASRQGLEETSTMTMTCGIGSPYYMSPEMLRGDQKYTRAVDVYSFSIMCVELWNELQPFSEAHFDTPFAFARYVLEGNRPAIRNDCPKELGRLIGHCWAEDRLDRPAFTDITKRLGPIVEEVKQNTPADTVHVTPRENPDIDSPSGTKGRSKSRRTQTKSRTKTKSETKTRTKTSKHKPHVSTDKSMEDFSSQQQSDEATANNNTSLSVSPVSSPVTPSMATPPATPKSPTATTSLAPGEVPMDDVADFSSNKLVNSDEK